MTRDVPLRETERREAVVFRTNARQAFSRGFVWLAHLELHGKQTQQLVSHGPVITNDILYLPLQGVEEIVRIEEATAQVPLNLKGVLPLHCLYPALDVVKFTVSKEIHPKSVDSMYADWERFALRDVAHLLEIEQIFRVS